MTQPDRAGAAARLSGVTARTEARRDAVLASDAEREKVCELLSAAFGDGRLTSGELDERTTRALVARTHGDLARAMRGLGAMGHPALWANAPEGPHRVGHKVLFWVVAFFTAPIVFLGSMLLFFGSDGGDRIAGVVMLVLFAPGLVALHGWAHPRH